jgi:hypothetical protein
MCWAEGGNTRTKSADAALDYLFEEIRPYPENGIRTDDITAVALKAMG